MAWDMLDESHNNVRRASSAPSAISHNMLATLLLTLDPGLHRHASHVWRGCCPPISASRALAPLMDTERLDPPQDENANALQNDEDSVDEARIDIKILKARINLLQRVSGLDRGLVANDVDVSGIDFAASELELGAKLDFDKSEDLAKLDGRWRLVHSSAFATGSLGGSRPGPSSNGPVRLGKVLQQINTNERRLDNIIEPVYIDTPAPFPSSTANVRLGHVLEVVGMDEICITSDGSSIQPQGLPSFDIQNIKLPFADEVLSVLPQEVQDALQRLGSSTFRVSYLDDDVYITRGDRSELRVFVRETTS